MRLAYIALLLALPLALFAQVNFDPIRLDNQEAIEYYYPLVEWNGTSLLCAWSYVSDTSVATHGIHASWDGQLSDPVIFGQRHREDVYCPPKLTYLHAANNTRPYMLYHSCTADFEFLTFAYDGAPPDTMRRNNAIAPTATALPNGLFLTYESQSLIGHQVLVWTDFAGSVTEEDTVPVNQASVKFVYTEGTRAVLVEYNPHQAGQLVAIDAVLHPFEADGSALPTDTLYSATLPNGWLNSNDAVFEYADGILRMLVPTVKFGPLQYNVRLVEHTPGNTVVYDAFDPGPLPGGYFASNWSVAPGPWGTSIIGFTLAGGSPQHVWLEGLDADGHWTGLLHTEDMLPNQTVNGVDMLAAGGTVYASFTTNPLGADPGGPFLFAFPQEEILAAEDNFIPRPLSFTLSSYPNPFNAVTRLDYELSAASPVEITIFDLTGRQVTALVSEMQPAGRHSVSWNAENAPSGLYLARLTAGDANVTRKLVLLK